MSDPTLWLAIAGGVVTVLAALTALGQLGRWVWRTARKLGHLVDDLAGEPARDGHPARPSLMARVTTLEERTAELKPNGGGSIKDQINRMETRLASVERRLGGDA
jgi:hypothetical protein